MYICRDDWHQWAPELATWLDKRFASDVQHNFNSAVEPDWLTWLDEQQAAVDGSFVDSTELFENVLQTNYLGIRVFHATRLPNIEAIRKQGLRAWSERDLRDLANSTFANEIDREALRSAIERSNPAHRSYRNGMLYSFASLSHALGVWDDSATGRLPYFATQGSEFLASVAKFAGLDYSPPGRGYFFACDLPWNFLTTADREYLIRDVLLTTIISRFLESTTYNMLGNQECISTTCDVAPNHIALVADVEDLVGRSDLSLPDLHWEPWQR